MNGIAVEYHLFSNKNYKIIFRDMMNTLAHKAHDYHPVELTQVKQAPPK